MKKSLLLSIIFNCIAATAIGQSVFEPEAIDLGLSVKWASYNLGAEKPESLGLRFAWGEINSKEEFSSENYKYYSVPYYYTDKDGFRVLSPGKWEDIGADITSTEYDAAASLLKGEWRMPTLKEAEELFKKCVVSKAEKNGVIGLKVTADNGNWIFLPNIDWNNSIPYWTSTRFKGTIHVSAEEEAYTYGNYSYPMSSTWSRTLGCFIRPVYGPINIKKEVIIYDVVSEMPSFPGGEKAMVQYFNSNLVFPKDSAEKGITGRVMVTFIVRPDGSLDNIKVTKGIAPNIDKEATRLVEKMPKWHPGKQHGVPVDVNYTVMIPFKLQK